MMGSHRTGGQVSSPGWVTSIPKLMLQGAEVPQGHGGVSPYPHARLQAILLTSAMS